MSRIRELVGDLRAQGIEVGGLEELHDELDGLERPLWERTKGFFESSGAGPWARWTRPPS